MFETAKALKKMTCVTSSVMTLSKAWLGNKTHVKVDSIPALRLSLNVYKVLTSIFTMGSCRGTHRQGKVCMKSQKLSAASYTFDIL